MRRLTYLAIVAIVVMDVAEVARAAPAADTDETVGAVSGQPERPWVDSPYPRSEVIRGVEFDVSTRKADALGSDIWPITWADDDNQYAAFGDGVGFGAGDYKQQSGRDKASLGVARIEGPWDRYRGVNVWGGKNTENPVQFKGKSAAMLCVEGNLYMLVARAGSSVVSEISPAVSRDHSRTWKLADWTWAPRQCRLSAGSFLNFGKNYDGARDEYVYAYFTYVNDRPEKPRNWMYETPGRVDHGRVPKDRILDQAAWQWFAGVDAQDGPRWTSDISARAHVFEDLNGIKVVSASYNRQLKRYLLTYSPKDNRGNFGLFESPEPWGPWRTVAYLRGYGPFMPPEPNRRVAVFHFPSKWLSEDGRQFTLLFNPGDDAWNTMRGRLKLAGEK